MKTKVIRSGDKNFEEEKAKMFEPMNKEEQLRIAFTIILKKNGVLMIRNFLQTYEMKEIIEELLREVKIRIKL